MELADITAASDSNGLNENTISQ